MNGINTNSKLFLIFLGTINSSIAATYNFNFYNKETIVSPTLSPSPETTSALKSVVTETPQVEPKVSHYRFTFSGIMDTYKKVEDNEKQDGLAYSNNNKGYRFGISFGTRESFIVTPYFQYTTFHFEPPTQFVQHCGNSYVGQDANGEPQYEQRCYDEAYRTDHQAKIPAGGLALEKRVDDR